MIIKMRAERLEKYKKSDAYNRKWNDLADAFCSGHDSRDKEVAELKAENERLKSNIKYVDHRLNADPNGE